MTVGRRAARLLELDDAIRELETLQRHLDKWEPDFHQSPSFMELPCPRRYIQRGGDIFVVDADTDEEAVEKLIDG